MPRRTKSPAFAPMRLSLTAAQNAALCLGPFVPASVRQKAWAVGIAPRKVVWLLDAEAAALQAAAALAAPVSHPARRAAFVAIGQKVAALRAAKAAAAGPAAGPAG